MCREKHDIDISRLVTTDVIFHPTNDFNYSNAGHIIVN